MPYNEVVVDNTGVNGHLMVQI